MKWLIVVSLLLVMVCGCASTSSGPSIEEILNNPEEYEDVKVNIDGILTQTKDSEIFNLGPQYKLNQLPLEHCIEGSSLSYKVGTKYDATGIIKSIELCTCQLDKYGGAWKDMALPIKPVTACEKYSNQRCGPTTVKTYYYLEYTEPMYS